MQDRYSGDIGDFVKFALLRTLCAGDRLGVAWYLYPDESHNDDGRHTEYLKSAHTWRHLDPEVFDGLRSVVGEGRRGIAAVEKLGLIDSVTYSRRRLDFDGNFTTRARLRAEWFLESLAELRGSRIVFAVPDNGLCDDMKFSPGKRDNWKRMPLSEAHVLSAGRTGIIYHHNSRFRGGHMAEIDHWLGRLGSNSYAVYWRRYSNRTFFILNPTEEMKVRLQDFGARWSEHLEIHGGNCALRRASRNRQTSTQAACERVCPECGHRFRGGGWGGIDAHWRSRHADIMSYELAWPIIRAGRMPSQELC